MIFMSPNSKTCAVSLQKWKMNIRMLHKNRVEQNGARLSIEVNSPLGYIRFASPYLSLRMNSRFNAKITDLE